MPVARTTAVPASDLCERIEARLPGALDGPAASGAVYLRAGKLVEVCEALRDDREIDGRYLNDISAVDRYDHFEVVYHVTSLSHNHAFALKVRTDHEAPEVPSVSAVWQAAHLQEREIYDLMGIRFTGHPDLKRLLLWEGFPGHPLRKDFLSLPGGVKPGLQRFPKEDPNAWGGEFRAN